MTHTVWFSFDLGVTGDYEGMYTWLARQKAEECGDSMAVFKYEHTGDLIAAIKRDIRDNVGIDTKKCRVYVIRLVEGKMKGSFIFGQRRRAPWAGYAETGDQADDTSD